MHCTLIIDDDPELAKLLTEHYSVSVGVPDVPSNATGGANGFDFILARNEAEALDIMAADDGTIEVAVVSVDGSTNAGLKIFRKLKGKRLRVPRIALTNGEDLGVIRNAMNGGAVDFLTKPVSLDDLNQTLMKVYADCEERRRAWKNEAELSAMRREMDLAGSMQQRILPATFPKTPEHEFYAMTTPALTMGGDFYDFFDLDDDNVAFVVADVSGKGVPAAFYMAMVRTLIRVNAREADGPGDCLERVNEQLAENNLPGMFVTVFFGVLNTKTWKMTFANGGHLPPYLVCSQSATIEEVGGGDGVVLGFEHHVPYTENSITLQKGDSLFVYTDGLTEAFDADRNQFSDERLMECLLDNRKQNAHALSKNVFAFVNLFTDGAPQSDDITSFVIKRF
ncbi:MAG: SpoIIE family protein phosphatase [Rhodospirillaceae bacterium]|nr:SpoIIE family protein phosphatase [Rhodospirillaceae bacterium]